MMEEKHRHRRENDLKALTDLITLLDCYRVNRYVQLDSMEKAVKSGQLGKFDVKWREIRRILYKIGGLPNLSASINKLVRIREGVKVIEIIGSYLFAFGLGVFVLSYFKVCPEWLESAYVYVGLPALIVLLGTRLTTEFINRKIALEIEELSKRHPEKFRFLRTRLRDIAQDLINRLGKHIKNRREDADKYRIDLYNTDYKGIKILKSPGTLRKHYTVVCKT
ncbi:MAG: hypothetical protein OEX76_07740 [Candidatus Bathyarchaeota archaeon]|nr:hypothetical protein [Candidatus Bathyarchaeota archaeon]MDH5713343.1 hypothetical protein [Candidatus Bathyarchaeota archaeon]